MEEGKAMNWLDELKAAIQEQLDSGVEEWIVEKQVLQAFQEHHGFVDGAKAYQDNWEARHPEGPERQ